MVTKGAIAAYRCVIVSSSISAGSGATAVVIVVAGAFIAIVVMKLASLIWSQLIIWNLFFSGRAFSFKGNKVTH